MASICVQSTLLFYLCVLGKTAIMPIQERKGGTHVKTAKACKTTVSELIALKFTVAAVSRIATVLLSRFFLLKSFPGNAHSNF